MSTVNSKSKTRERRHAKVRYSISGTSEKPRLSVYRSNKFIHAQIIDDEKGATLVGLISKGAKGKNKTESALLAGKKYRKTCKRKKYTESRF